MASQKLNSCDAAVAVEVEDVLGHRAELGLHARARLLERRLVLAVHTLRETGPEVP